MAQQMAFWVRLPRTGVKETVDVSKNREYNFLRSMIATRTVIRGGFISDNSHDFDLEITSYKILNTVPLPQFVAMAPNAEGG